MAFIISILIFRLLETLIILLYLEREILEMKLSQMLTSEMERKTIEGIKFFHHIMRGWKDERRKKIINITI